MLGRLAKSCNLCRGPRFFSRYRDLKDIQRVLALCPRCDHAATPPDGRGTQ